MNDPILQSKLDPTTLNQASRPTWLMAFLALFWVAITLPIVLWSSWFPLDMPALFEMGEYLEKWLPWIVSPHSGSGRYFPLYWLYHCVQFLLYGDTVWPYFLALNLIYLSGVLILSRTLWKITGNVALTSLFFILLYLNTPTAENIATIGKGEPLTFFVIACLISILHKAIEFNKTTGLQFVAFSICFVTSIWIKETSLVLWVLAIWGIATSWALGKVDSRYRLIAPVKPYVTLLAALVIGWALSKLPYFVFTKTSEQINYTSYDLNITLIKENFFFYLTQQPDVLAFAVLSTLLLVLGLVHQHRQMRSTGTSPAMAKLVFFSSICVMGWAYLFGMLIWRWPMAYYLLIPSIVFKFCALYGLYFLWQARFLKIFAAALSGVIVVLSVVYSAFNFYYVTTSQIAYSRIYHQALHEFARISEGKSPLVIESYTFYSEQIGGTRQFLKNQLGITAPLTGIGEILDPAALKPSIVELLQLTPAMLSENVQSYPRRGSYVLVFTGNKLATWFLRGVTPYFNEESLLKKEGVYDMELVSQKTITTPAVYLHEWTNKITTGQTSVGYRLYRVTSDHPRFLWLGRYPDGWVGLKSSLKIDKSYGASVTVKISVPELTLPNRVRILRNDVLYKELDLTTPDEISVNLGEEFSETTQLAFEVDRGFSPKAIGMNKDDRMLGARIALVPETAANSARTLK